MEAATCRSLPLRWNAAPSTSRILEATARAVARRADARDHDHELVAAHARDRVALAHAHEDAARHRLQQAVAQLVAERVVDGLEAVEVEEEHGELRAVAVRLRDGLLDAVAQQHAVGQPRERVVVRHVRDALLGELALGDVIATPITRCARPSGAAMDLAAVGEPVLVPSGQSTR